MSGLNKFPQNSQQRQVQVDKKQINPEGTSSYQSISTFKQMDELIERLKIRSSEPKLNKSINFNSVYNQRIESFEKIKLQDKNINFKDSQISPQNSINHFSNNNIQTKLPENLDSAQNKVQIFKIDLNNEKLLQNNTPTFLHKKQKIDYEDFFITDTEKSIKKNEFLSKNEESISKPISSIVKSQDYPKFTANELRKNNETPSFKKKCENFLGKLNDTFYQTKTIYLSNKATLEITYLPKNIKFTAEVDSNLDVIYHEKYINDHKFERKEKISLSKFIETEVLSYM